MSIYLASDRVKGTAMEGGREDLAFVMLLSAVPIICSLVKQKIKDKERAREKERERTTTTRRTRTNERLDTETNNNNNRPLRHTHTVIG